MNAVFLSLFLNVVTRNFRMSRSGRLLLDGNPKGYEISEHIATKVEVNQRMLSTLKNEKFMWSMKPLEHFDISVVVTLVISVDLVKRKIGQGCSKSGRFYGRPSISPFFAISFSLVIDTWPNNWWIIRESFCFESENPVGTTIFFSLWGLTLKILIWI